MSSGLVGCIESLRIASPRLNVEYDLHMPGSNDIESAHGIRAYIVTAFIIINPFKHNGVKWLRFEVFRAILS